jgi:hypothetical protein
MLLGMRFFPLRLLVKAISLLELEVELQGVKDPKESKAFKAHKVCKGTWGQQGLKVLLD